MIDLRNAMLCDVTLPYLDAVADVEGHERAGFAFVSLTVAADDKGWPSALFHKLAGDRRRLTMQPDRFVFADTVEDIRRARREGKLAVGFHFQGSEPVARDLSLVEAYYRLGVRWMLIAYNAQNSAGTGCIEGEVHDGGLTPYGRRLVAEMNRVGMIVDIAHTGHRTTLDTMEASESPCIFSHANVNSIYPHPRNVRDEEIDLIAQQGGLIGLTGVGSFIGTTDPVQPDEVFRQIDYVVQRVGPQHAMLGLDYMSPAMCDWAVDHFEGDISRVGMLPLPWHFLAPERIVDVVKLMEAAGYPDEAQRGILGENFLRLAESVWR